MLSRHHCPTRHIGSSSGLFGSQHQFRRRKEITYGKMQDAGDKSAQKNGGLRRANNSLAARDGQGQGNHHGTARRRPRGPTALISLKRPLVAIARPEARQTATFSRETVKCCSVSGIGLSIKAAGVPSTLYRRKQTTEIAITYEWRVLYKFKNSNQRLPSLARHPLQALRSGARQTSVVP